MTVTHPVHVSDDEFPAQIEGHAGLAVVDFWATWCGPCQMIAPVLEQIAHEYEGRVKVAKMDVDANPKTSMRFNVRSIPTLLFFKDGKPVDSVVGAVPKGYLVNKLNTHLG